MFFFLFKCGPPTEEGDVILLSFLSVPVLGFAITGLKGQRVCLFFDEERIKTRIQETANPMFQASHQPFLNSLCVVKKKCGMIPSSLLPSFPPLCFDIGGNQLPPQHIRTLCGLEFKWAAEVSGRKDSMQCGNRLPFRVVVCHRGENMEYCTVLDKMLCPTPFCVSCLSYA